MGGQRHYLFGEFRLDAEQRALFRGNELVPLAPKLLETLLFLVERPGRILDKKELMDAVWRGVIVEEVGLARNVSALRKILSAGVEVQSYIETVPKRGYRFVAPVRVVIGQADAGQSIETTEISGGPAVGDTPEEATSGERALESTPATYANRRQGVSVLLPTRWSGQRILRASVSLALLALAAVGILLLRNLLPEVHVPSNRAMLAILPVRNLTGDASREYMSDGMTEELITQLGSLDPEHLGVIARTSSMAYKNSTKTVGEIGRELGVQYILEGSLRGNEEHTRFTAQLIRTSDQTHLWAQDYDRGSRNLLALEDEISRTVALEIEHRLASRPRVRSRSPRIPNADSYQGYLLGRYYWNKGDEQNLRRSIDLYRKALAQDPDNALAEAGLADSYSALSDWYMPPRAVMPEAKSAALRALELDESLPAAHNALCLILTNYEWNWSGAERECRRAIELNPNSADAHDNYGFLLAYMGRAAEAAAELRRAEELDPLSFRIYCDGAFAAFLARNYPLAVEQAKRSIDLDPDYFMMRGYLALIYVQMSRNGEAIVEAEKGAALTDSALMRGFLAYVYAATGRAEQARKLADALKLEHAQQYSCAFEIATTELWLGQKDEAFRWLETAIDDRSLCVTSMKFDPRLDPVRADPRYLSLIRRVGFPAGQ